MKKVLFAAAALCVALTACDNKSSSSLPQECQDYLARAKACFAKSAGDAAATAFQQGIDQSAAQWETMADKSALGPACKQANDAFNQTATMLKCE